MFYFRVNPDSELVTKLGNAKVMKSRWFSYKDQLYTCVGLPVIPELVMSNHTLHYPNDPPKELRDQFKKYRERNLYVAKANSIINQQWRKMCADFGLTFVKEMTGILAEELFKTPYAIGSQLKTMLRLDNDFYLEGEKELPGADFLEPISEATYLAARLEFAKKQEEIASQAQMN